jgi:hypothetical protein
MESDGGSDCPIHSPHFQRELINPNRGEREQEITHSLLVCQWEIGNCCHEGEYIYIYNVFSRGAMALNSLSSEGMKCAEPFHVVLEWRKYKKISKKSFRMSMLVSYTYIYFLVTSVMRRIVVANLCKKILKVVHTRQRQSTVERRWSFSELVILLDNAIA